MMAKKTKLLLGLLALTLLWGCGSTANTKTTPPAAGQASETAAVTENPEAENAATDAEASAEEGTGASGEAPAEETSTQETAPDDTMQDIPLKDLCADYFTLGVGINGSTLENQTLNIPRYMELSKKHFNSCTMTNLMKSGYILDQRGSQESLKNGDGAPALTFWSIDPTLLWCQENGMKMRGHTLVWHTQAPDWFFREGYENEGEFVSKEVMLFRMESYIKQLLYHVQTEYPGVIYCWDVVNEAVDPDSPAPESFFMCRTKIGDAPNPWYATIGEDYVEKAFTYARKYADPDVKLFYNDYNTYQAPKTENIYKLCEALKEKGLIDGIGMQGYWGLDYPADAAIENAIRKFAELELEIQITELSIGVDQETEAQFQRQGDKYARVFQMFHDLDTAAGGPANITNVTVFGLVDHYREGDTTNTRIFDKDYMPKPAYYAIRRVMAGYSS